jgi:hypothetical protein
MILSRSPGKAGKNIVFITRPVKTVIASFMSALILLACAPIQSNKPEKDQQQPAFRLSAWHEKIWLAFEIPIIAIEPVATDDRVLYLWFYENTFFDAVEKGWAEFHGDDPSKLTVSDDGLFAEVIATDNRQLKLECRAAHDGVDLLLTVANNTDYTWPEVAALTPCFFPGSTDSRFPDPPIDELFRDEERARTWFAGIDGLLPLQNTDLHFNHRLRPQVEASIQAGQGDKNWVISKNAATGLMLRESSDGRWVAGIAWEDFLSAQGHNPLRCMHLSVRVGPLAPGETRTVKGKIYLFQGTRIDCLNRFNDDFGNTNP